MADVFGAIGNAVAAPVKILGTVRNAYYDPQGTKQRAMEQSIEANDIEIGRAKMQAVGDYIKQYVAPSDLPRAMNDLIPMLQQDPQILKAVPQLKNFKIKTDFGPDVDKAKRQAALGNIMGASKEYAEGNISPQVASQAMGSNVIDAGFGPVEPINLLPNQKSQYAPKSFNVNKSMFMKDGKYYTQELDQNGQPIGQPYLTPEKDVKSGSTNISVDMGVSKPTATSMEGDISSGMQSISALENIVSELEKDPSVINWGGRTIAFGQEMADKVGAGKLTGTEQLKKLSKFKTDAGKEFLKYRKWVTGVAGSVQEFARIADTYPDQNESSPAKYIAQAKAAIADSKRVISLLTMMKNQGLPINQDEVEKYLRLTNLYSIPETIPQGTTIDDYITQSGNNNPTKKTLNQQSATQEDVKSMSNDELIRKYREMKGIK